MCKETTNTLQVGLLSRHRCRYMKVVNKGSIRPVWCLLVMVITVYISLAFICWMKGYWWLGSGMNIRLLGGSLTILFLLNIGKATHLGSTEGSNKAHHPGPTGALRSHTTNSSCVKHTSLSFWASGCLNFRFLVYRWLLTHVQGVVILTISTANIIRPNLQWSLVDSRPLAVC